MQAVDGNNTVDWIFVFDITVDINSYTK